MHTIHDISIHTYTRQKRKTLCLSINPKGEISLKVPLNVSETEVHDFVLRKKKWLLKKLEKFAKLDNKCQGPLSTGQSIYFLGKAYTLIIQHDTKSKEVHLDGDRIFLYTAKPHDERHNLRLMQRWFLTQAERIFHERLSLALIQFPHMPRPLLRIRKYKGRWGSYASNHVMKTTAQYCVSSKRCSLVEKYFK